MIELRDLTRVYRTEEVETTALNSVSLTVPDKDFLAVMGPSGCGKSTLLSILGMLDSPNSGNYIFDGRDVSGWGERQLSSVRKKAIGFVFQSFNLIDNLTVFENIELPLRYMKVAKAERRERVETLMRRFSIDHRAGHFPQQLSGGQQQRVAIARAVVKEPKLILADEPTGNLDSKNGEEVMSLLRDLNEAGTTIVMATHSDMNAEFAKRVLHLFDGQIISTGVAALREVSYA